MQADPPRTLFRTAELRAVGVGDDELRGKVRRGELVRIRRGTYCLAATWAEADERERHLLRAAAVVADTAAPILALRSAAAVWDIPVLGLEWPTDVTMLTRHSTGGKSEPGVRRTSAGAADASTTWSRGLPVTTPARTVIDLAAVEGFVPGVMAADWALRSGVTLEELWDAAATRGASRGHRVVADVLRFADPRAENGGESAARAAIHRVGFVVPELQKVFRDEEGEMRSDFWWAGPRRAGEFDGRRKYFRDEYTDGDPARVVWREKRREDRLRRQVDGVVRLIWDDILTPATLVRILSDAGIPRRSSRVADGVAGPSLARLIQPSGRYPTAGRLDG